MDIELFDECQEDMPKFVQEILDGLAYTGLKTAKDDVNRLISCTEKSYPEGLEYLGYSVCSPQKAYRVMSRSLTRGDSKASASIDLAPSDVVLVEYRYAYHGTPMHPRYFFLPYARKGGFITITGKNFHLGTVLADPCFSVGEDRGGSYVFVRLNRAPVTFRRMIVSVNIDGEDVSRHVAWSKLHNKGGSVDRKNESDTIHVGRVPTTLPHYLFARYGVHEAFEIFARTDVIITTEEALRDDPLDPAKYVMIRSFKTQPPTLKYRGDYKDIASTVVLAIPREKMTPLAQLMAAGFFYMVDHYPEMRDPAELAESWTWKVWMGYVLWGDQLGHAKLVENVETHLRSLDDYVDIEAKRMLLDEEGVDVENLFELFAYILIEMEEMIATKESDIGTMYGKRLVTTPYILRDIYEQIFRCLFEITNNRKRKHKIDDLNKILGKYFTPVKIFDLRKINAKAYVTSVSTPGDNMFFKATSRLVQQSQTSGGSTSLNLNVNERSSWLHASTLEAGNALVLPKNCPLARNTINPTVLLDAKKTILRKDSMRETVDYVDDIINRD